ncbi:ANTAR domain-containing protein [Paractinoplanes durhamensis]|uniref:ANTAR domain-containing protein n=2 Tax=Paractinoplanes durhamensis TaxID=113563 RepID=UPI0031E06B45
MFIELADTLVDDFDLLDFLHVLTERCVQLLGVDAAGLLLIDEAGVPQLVAASSEFLQLESVLHTLPMRLRTDVIGALNLFGTAPGPLGPEQLRMGQALADIATVGLIQQRAIHRGEVLGEQLQAALNNQMVIEQATGLLAERLQVGVAEAFETLLAAARHRDRHLSDLARALVEGTEDLT